MLLLNRAHALQEHSETIYKEETGPVPALPQLKTGETAKANRLSTQLSAYVEEYRFYGNTVFLDDELIAITLPYSNRGVNTEELIELKDKITRHYVNNGFINSGAILPDQDIEGGYIVFQIQEGFIEKTHILAILKLGSHWQVLGEDKSLWGLTENSQLI